MINNKKDSPAKFLFGLGTLTSLGIIGGGIAAYSASKKDKALRKQLGQATGDFDKRLADYEQSRFQALGLEPEENLYEEMEVDTMAEDYAKEQFQQQQANIMAGLRGAAGASGVAGLAQTLSMQASDQARQSQVSIGQQLAEARRLKITEQSRIKQAERQLQLQNQADRRAFEAEKLQTLMGVEGERIGAIRGEQAGRRQMYGQIAGGVGSLAGNLQGKWWKK